MRIAVYTNTRVTFQCCTSVHKGFVTAFRGGQVLGFVLVGMGIMNIMIIILLFKACWYNKFLKDICAAGRPFNRCPAGDYTGFTSANTELGTMYSDEKTNLYNAWYTAFIAASANKVDCTGAPVAGTTTALMGKVTAFLKATTKCKATNADFLATTCETTDCKGMTYTDYFTKDHKGSLYSTKEYFWTNADQLNCTMWYNAENYKWKQRICVLTRRLFELIAGYGLGGSSVALFGRVGGGIYTKAADVGADLVGKVIKDLKEDDITNPGTIADNVGDNVGDIAGMGSDLFGSLAESTCAALVVSATSYQLITTSNALFFPICITASGTVASWISVLLVHVRTVTMKNVQAILKFQIGASTAIMTACVCVPVFLLPKEFTFEGGAEKIPITLGRWTAYGCVMFGLWSGMIIGFITEYYTNNAYAPTLWLADACDKGAAPNIILGLALGYISVVVPITCITATIGFAFATSGMYGIGLSALGMLGSLPVALSVDGFGPISDNAGGIAEMSGLPTEIRDLTDSLDAAGNTTAAVGKGFAIGSACLVGLALFGAFITRIGDTSVDILMPV